ncbi:MAG: reactivating factor for ethanolamine ammonia lyase [Rhodospirillales bacterium]|nr:reactivating factor for ethanolamine ammonia lyase [Rhodospirillales bacterium]
MPHDADGQVHWHEPAGLTTAGLSRFRRPRTVYDRFMEDEGIPIVRGAAIGSLLDLPLASWARTGGRGSYIQLFGTENAWGSYVVEVPGAGALHAEKHLYEKIFLVLEGRGTTEVWREGDNTSRHVFEWQRGSMFSIPMNALHRLVNATAAPALLLAGTTAPGVLNLLGDARAVFANSFAFADMGDDPFTPYADIEPDPVRALAMCRTNLVPDALGCDLPLDNRFSPGYRQMELQMTGTVFHAVIGEHRPGRYSKAHLLPPGAATIWLGGAGFSYIWPERLGPTPWRDGAGDSVLRFDHEPFGMLAVGPGGERWYHQSFGTGDRPLRHALWSGTLAPGRDPGPPGEEVTDPTAIDHPDGGTAVPYWLEDPQLRAEHAAAMARAGVADRMTEADYLPPEAAG